MVNLNKAMADLNKIENYRIEILAFSELILSESLLYLYTYTTFLFNIST